MSKLRLNNDNIHDMVKKYIAGDRKITRYGSIGNWNVSNVTNMSNLFQYEDFNEDISKWNVSNVTNMNEMFFSAENFNQPLNTWNVSNVIEMNGMFMGAENFNQSLNSWNVSNVRDMHHMFEDATSFNQPLNTWNVSNVTNMSGMFKRAKNFNQSLDSWDVSNVIDMNEMFYGAEIFNQPLNSWDVSNVIDMSVMFADAKVFNQPLNSWNVTNVTYMTGMFYGATNFNQPLNSWNVSNVLQMDRMFKNAAKFNQPLNSWIIGEQTETKDMFLGATSMQEVNKPRISRAILPQLVDQQSSPKQIALQSIQEAIQRIPQVVEEDSVNFSTENDCYDIINGEDIPIKQALQNENIVFVFYTDDIKKSSRVAVPIQSVTDAFKLENLYSYIIYQCITAGTMRQDNINTTKPYFDIKKLTGFGDLIELQKIDPANQKVFIFKQIDEKIVSTVSYDALFGHETDRYVSARHCQEGQDSTVYKPVQFTLTSDPVGGRKIKRKIRSSTRKRTNTKKTVTKKRKTKKNKRN